MREGVCMAIASAFVDAGATKATIARLSPDRRFLKIIASEGLAPLPTKGVLLTVLQSGFTKKTLTQRGPFVFYRSSDEKTYGQDPWTRQLGRFDTDCWAEAALVSEEGAIGVVFVDWGHEGPSTSIIKDYLAWMTKVCQAGGLRLSEVERLENYATNLQAQKKLRLIDWLIAKEADRLYQAKNSRIDHLTQNLADEICSTVAATGLEITFSKGEFHESVAKSGELQIGLSLQKDDPLAEYSVSLECIKQNEPIIRSGKRTDPFFEALRKTLSPGDAQDLLNSIMSWGAFPAVLSPQMAGILSVMSTEVDYFTEEKRDLLKACAAKIGVVLSIREISERLEEQARRSRDQSIQLSEMTAGQSFASAARMVVHNIGNMLTPIGADLDKIDRWVTRRRGKFPSASLNSLSDSLASVEDILQTYRKLNTSEGPARRYFKINELLDDAVEFCKPRAESYGINVVENYSPYEIKAHGNPIALLQAFINIIVNSIDAMTERGAKKGGTITVRTSLQNGTATLRFEDEGIGIRMENSNDYFRPDFTTKKRGTGLGLAHVKRVVQEFGGEVEISGALNKGATVTIRLKPNKEII